MPTNYALPASGGSVSTTSNTASKGLIIDGAIDNPWTSVNPPSVESPETVEITLSQMRNVTLVELIGYYGGATEPVTDETVGGYRNTNFTVEYWDGAAYQNIAGVTGNVYVKKSYTLNINASKIRVAITSGYGGYAAFSEIRVWGNPVSGGDTLPPTVTAFSAAATSSSTINISMTATDNVAVTGIDLDWSANGSTGWTALLANVAPTSPYNHTGRAPSTTYYYRFRARDAAGNVSNYSTASATTSAASDTTAPTGSITSPASGSTVSGTALTCSVSAADNVGLYQIQLKVDGGAVGSPYYASGTSDSYPFSLNTTNFSNGAHTLTALITDTSNNTFTTAAVTININNATSDTTPPTGSITSPSNGQTVSGTINVAVSATDNIAVAGVQLKVDGGAVGAADTSAPYSFSLDTTALANGSHTLTALITDTSGNTFTTAAVSVTVNNIAAPPPVPTITSQTPLPSARIGQPYSFQLQKSGGSGSGTWSVIIGNLPSGALSASGLLTIPTVGSSNYTFTIRFTDTNGTSADKAFSIPGFALAIFDFEIDFPLSIEHTKEVRVFKPRVGARQTRTDAPAKRKIKINSEWFAPSEIAAVIAFWTEHFPDKNFLFYDADRSEYFEAWISTNLKEERQTGVTGKFLLTIEEV